MTTGEIFIGEFKERSLKKIKKLKEEEKKRKQKRKEPKINGSMKELLFEPDLKQKACIRVGNALEETVQSSIGNRNFTLEMKGLYEKAFPNTKEFNGKKDKIMLDVHLQRNERVYSLEIKSNLNLDVGKSKRMSEELNKYKELHKYMFGDMKSVVKVVQFRFPCYEKIPKTCFKYNILEKDFIWGYEDFFQEFSININQWKWEEAMKQLGREIEKYLQKGKGNETTC